MEEVIEKVMKLKVYDLPLRDLMGFIWDELEKKGETDKFALTLIAVDTRVRELRK